METEIIDQIKAEYFDYTQTAAMHDSAIDELCIMQQCFEELPDIVSDEHAKKVIDCFYAQFGSKIMLDLKTIKQLIVTLALIDLDQHKGT